MFRIAAAAYPMSWLNSWEDWLAKTTAWVCDARDGGADLLVFPEYGAMELATLAGAEAAGDLEASLTAVSERMDAAHDHWERLAREQSCVILAPSGPQFTGTSRPVNRAVLFGPTGRIGHQDKQIMTRFEAEHWDVRPGDEGLSVFDTELGRIGVLICYDSEFPLLGRRLVEQGAEIILVPSCTEARAGYSRVRIGAQARALEGQCITVMSSTVGACEWSEAVDLNCGRGGIFSPPDRGFPEDGVIAQGVLNQPGWSYGSVDLEAVRAVRADGGVLNLRDWARQ